MTNTRAVRPLLGLTAALGVAVLLTACGDPEPPHNLIGHTIDGTACIQVETWEPNVGTTGKGLYCPAHPDDRYDTPRSTP